MIHSDLISTNALEKKIFHDKEFRLAINTGRARKYHEEGTIKNHILEILSYIDSKYKDSKYYSVLRILAILHDVGKFASVQSHIIDLMPIMPEKDQEKFLAASQMFAEKYPIPDSIRDEFHEYKYTSKHAYVSYLFAKNFLKDKDILELIRFHDIGIDFKNNFEKAGHYDAEKFRKIYSKLSLELYLIFVDCDRLGRKSDEIPWIKGQLKLHKLY